MKNNKFKSTILKISLSTFPLLYCYLKQILTHYVVLYHSKYCNIPAIDVTQLIYIGVLTNTVYTKHKYLGV